MSAGKDRNVGTGLAVGAILLGTLGDWKTVVDLLPVGARPYAESPLMAIIFALAAIYFLWRAASHSAELERQAADALRLANDSNKALERRVKSAEEKLVKALDQQVISWAPAYAKLEEEAKANLQRMAKAPLEELMMSILSIKRRTDRGYLPGDDISKPPPNDP